MKFKNLIAKIAPVAATLAAGLGGPVAGTAVKFIAEKLGVAATPQAIEKELASNPDALLLLRAEDHRYEEQMTQKGIDVFALRVQDKSSARQMAERVGMWPQIALMVIYNLGYFGLMYMLISGEWTLPEGPPGLLIAGLIGVLTATLKDVNQFFVGSSMGSKTKD